MFEWSQRTPGQGLFVLDYAINIMKTFQPPVLWRNSGSRQVYYMYKKAQ